MVQLGLKITQPADPLQKITLERLYNGLKNPKPEFQDFIRQLRTVAGLDQNKYRELKKQLPYFVCGIFQPPVRKRENFAYIRYFIIDLDHIAGAGINKDDLCARLRAEDEVTLYFTSPGGDGLKIMFQLEENCSDAAMFSAFYKVFARRFAEKFGLLGAIDLRTHDVTRACFMSHDPEAYFNPISSPVRMQDHLSNLDFEEAEKEIREAEKILKEAPAAGSSDEQGRSLDGDILQRIKEKLNPNLRVKPEKNIVAPPQLAEVIPVLREKLAEMEMEIRLDEPIHYGRKLHIGAGMNFAEINLFFGQRGFKVVATTKTGSNPDLAVVAARAIEEIIAIHILNLPQWEDLRNKA